MNIFNYSDAPDDLHADFVETDNPEFSLEKTGDAVAVCAAAVFGIQALFPWQRLAIANILDAVHAVQAVEAAEVEQKEGCIDGVVTQDEDGAGDFFEEPTELYDEDGVHRGRQVVLLPTGAGKSLCFQVPALLLDKPTLIVYPLLALMADQHRRMKEAGLDPVLLRGGQSKEERESQFARLEGSAENSPAKLIIANPEILASETILSKIKQCGISHLAIDEAHCVSEWGDSFRPAYLNLSEIIKQLDPPAVTAFTATASPYVLKRISEVLFDGRAHIVRGNSDRPNLRYFVRHCRIKRPALLAEVKSRKLPMVVFCGTRARTENTAAFLIHSLHNDNIKFYHAGLERDEKDRVERWFHNHDNAILVTTCAWGMGVDKKNVRTVIHLDPSPTVEAYIQEAGRSGRDGKVSEAILLWSLDDKTGIESLPKQQRLRAEVMIKYAESGRCRREVLLEALGEEISGNSDVETTVCSGCDICNRSATQFAKDEKSILEFIKKTNRVFTQQELVSLLKNQIKNWRTTDLNLLLKKLKDEKKIISSNSIFWKQKLRVS
ncbi:MAG: RecQ family ATP-dependent DNA helicase [Treponema sp.]|nr:MAG: RecQ family ATP-dependent DNA helicase [Treponema sp.]